MGDQILRHTIGPYQKHANGIWSCYTTAYARNLLYNALIKVKESGGLLIYCDTDSIIFESDKKIFKPSDQLGELKLEGEFRYGHFKLPKFYCLIPKKGALIYKTKGVPRKVAKDFFKKGKVSFRRPYKLREVLRRNMSPKRIEKLIPNYWEVTEKEVKRIYNKRKVLRDGTTKPIILGL